MCATLARHALAAIVVAVPSGIAAQTLQEAGVVRAGARPVLVVFADGNVRNVVSENGDATSPSGALGMTYRGTRFVVSGLVNVASRVDTVTREFGASMLPPAAGQAFNSGLLDVRLAHVLRGRAGCPPSGGSYRCRVGAHGYLSASQARWATAQDADGTTRAATNVPIWGTGLGLYYNFFNGRLSAPATDPSSEDPTARRTQSASMTLDVGFVSRSIRGDFSADRETRQRLIGTTRTTFPGFEVGLGLRYNEINAGLTYYRMAGTVPGFSRGQVVAGVSLRATLNSGEFDEAR
jgi:hypothetical protein